MALVSMPDVKPSADQLAVTDEMGSTGTAITGATTMADCRCSQLPNVVDSGAYRAAFGADPRVVYGKRGCCRPPFVAHKYAVAP